jgi:vacuolar-type H+-ATPase subunit F/Vma7
MTRVVYIGDPPGAAGFRLAGVETLTPEAGDERDTVEQVLANCALLMVSTRVAASLATERRETLESALTPLFIVLPDSDDVMLPPDRLAGVLGQLGVET